MKDLSDDLNSLRALCQKLRVPELKYLQEYASSNDHALTLEGLKDHFFRGVDYYDGCLLDYLNEHFPGAQKGFVNNIAFVLDRTFDVWLRKSNFPKDIASNFTNWRFAIFATMLLEEKVFDFQGVSQKQVLEGLVDLLEMLATDSIGWSAVPERSKHLLLDQLQSVSDKALCQAHAELSVLDQASNEWLAFQAKQSAKVSKVSERLVTLESQQCWKRFSYWCAQSYVDAVFSNKRLPESLQCFLDSYWVSAVAEKLVCSDGVNARLDQDVSKLTQSLMRTFCKQGEELFKHADTLVDDLRKTLDELEIKYDESILEALEASLVSLLKQEFSHSFVSYSSLPTDSSIAEQFSHFDITQILNKEDPEEVDDSVDYGLKLSEWYVMGEDQSVSPSMKLLAYYKYAGSYLFSNYLGMKTALFSKKEMAELIKAKKIKPLKIGDSLSVSLASCLKGLTRVADSQQKARIAAAEKAKAEAERLLEEKRKADEEAARRAEEIAQRTKELLKKREDKRKADQEAEALKLVQQLNIGAWVSLILEDKAERFKLVVKIAASGKYIFVDKLGIKKKEYKESDLIELVTNNQLEFLSDGAEFEDSLQRVVSRLRMTK